MTAKLKLRLQLLLTTAMMCAGAALIALGGPSATFTAQIVGAGGGGPIACDVGPQYTGSIPNGAAVAGYTHCLMNLDFTDPSFFTNISSWLDCMGAGSPIMWAYSSAGPAVPCDSTHFEITTDGGVQVFKMTYSQADNANGSVETRINSAKYQGNRVTLGTTFPLGNYVEMTSRVGAINTYADDNFHLMWAPFFYNPETGDNDVFLEEDWGEMDDSLSQASPIGLNTAAGWWNCTGGGGVCFGVGGVSPQAQVAQLSYNTIGMLSTGDGSSATAICAYQGVGAIQGLQHSNFVSCQPGNWQNPAVGGDVWARTQMIVPLGTEGVGAATTLTKTQSVFVQRITVFVCPGGGQPGGGATFGNQCNVSPVLQSSPPL